MTCMTGIVDSVMPSTGEYLTLRCPGSLISLADTSCRALLCISSPNINIENRVSASLQLGWRMAILSVVDDGIVSGRSDGDCLASKPMEEQASCF